LAKRTDDAWDHLAAALRAWAADPTDAAELHAAEALRVLAGIADRDNVQRALGNLARIRDWQDAGRPTILGDASLEAGIADWLLRCAGASADDLANHLRELRPNAKTVGHIVDAAVSGARCEIENSPYRRDPTATPTPDAAAAAKRPATPSNLADGGNGWTWQTVLAKLDEIRLTGKRFTSRQRLASDIGCTKFLVQKAISNGTAEVQAWATKPRRPSRLNAAPEVAAVAFDDTPQAREPDPADITEEGDIDAAMAYLLDQAGPAERARINAMSPAEKRVLAETFYRDPDQEEQQSRYDELRRSKKRLRRD
jgi:hypothetical protein